MEYPTHYMGPKAGRHDPIADGAHLPTSGSQKSLFIELQISVQIWCWFTHKNLANTVHNDDIQLYHYAL